VRYARCAHPTLILRARGRCDALFHPCTLALRACSRAGRLHADPKSCAHFPNEFLYQFGIQSVQTFGRQCWIGGDVRMFARASMRTRDQITSSHCPNKFLTNLGPDRLSRLAAYTVCVVLCARLRALCARLRALRALCARLRALRAHQCTLAIADPHNVFTLSK
jgi:hypothetical protein